MSSQAMNYIVVSVLYDRFHQLNEEFGKCIGDRGEFGGNLEQFRRRHQAVSRSVQEADRFLMISNLACFCCQISSIVLILYSTIFYRDDTVSLGGNATFLYIVWLGISLLSLSLAAGQAAILNHAVSSFFIITGNMLQFFNWIRSKTVSDYGKTRKSMTCRPTLFPKSGDEFCNRIFFPFFSEI